MRDVLNWSLPIGRWAGVQVRLHAFFLLLTIFILHEMTDRGARWPLWYALFLLGMLLTSLLVHELAHVMAARRCGGHSDGILIWPLGGLLPAAAARDPRAELLVAAAGPLANLLICAATLPALLLQNQWGFEKLNVLAMPSIAPPAMLGWSCLPVCLALAFWLNWTLFVVNLLPAYPLDGGRMMHSVLWLSVGQRFVALGCTVIGQWTGLALLVGAWLVHDLTTGYAWAPLVGLGVILFFSAREAANAADDQRTDDPLGYDFSQGYTSLEREADEAAKGILGPVGRWLEERREARQERQRQIEEDEERRVDDILARLHTNGLQGLSAEDRQILDRVSERYRNRQKR